MSQESDVKIIASRSPSFDGPIETNSDPVQTLQKELDRNISGLMQWGKCCPLTSRGAKKDEDGNVVKPRNTRKISKQFLFFGVILIRSPCHYYDVKKKPALLLPLKKCGHTSQ